MSVILKIDKGTAEKLIKWLELKPTQSKNLIGKELTLEIENDEVVIEPHYDKKFIEIADINGSFGVWVQLNKEKSERLKEILDKMGL